MLRTKPSAELWILCLDEETRSIVAALDLDQVHLLSVPDLLEFEPRLRNAQEDRPALEFYYACTPQIVRYVRQATADERGVTYIDADMYFFGSPDALYAEAPEAEILLVEHRSGDREAEAQRGRFNVSFVHFSSAANAFHALEWWCDATLESTAMNDLTWGDQKYLDRFPRLFSKVGVLRGAATTLAPWNVWQHDIHRRGGVVRVDGAPLVAFHFARLLVVGPHLFSPARREWLPREVLDSIYRPYFREIRSSLAQIRRASPGYSVGYTRRNHARLTLALLAGRVFYEGGLGVRRLGFYLPNTRKELWLRRQRHIATTPSRPEPESLPAQSRQGRLASAITPWFRDTSIVRQLPLPYRGYALHGRVAERTGIDIGGGFLFRLIGRAYELLGRESVVAVRVASSTLFLDVHDRRVFWALDELRLETPESRALGALVREGDTFIDVGANHGAYSVLAGSLVGATGLVLAFEPQSRLAGLVARSLRATGVRSFEVFDIAVSDQSVALDLYVPRVVQHGSGAASVHSTYAAGRSPSVIRVASSSLDACLRGRELPGRVFVKIDAEGSELAVLRGARDVMTTHRPVVLFEVNPLAAVAAGYRTRDLLSFLQELGYTRFAELDDLPTILSAEDVVDIDNPYRQRNLLALPDG